MTNEHVLTKLENCVAGKNPFAMKELLSKLNDLPDKPEKILAALGRGLERARKNFADKKNAIPDLLLSIDCYSMASDWVKERSQKIQTGGMPTVVIGVVEGDVHHMGKNIVAAVLRANGYQVHDAGKDVSNEKFLDLVTKNQASLLALSVMMSTPQGKMADLIRMVRIVSPKTRVIVGGASMDKELSRSLGADGYAENAAFVPQEFSRVLSEGSRLCA